MKKKLCVIIAVVIILINPFSVISIAENETVSELTEKRKLAQEEISKNTAKVDELQIQISDLMAEIQNLTDSIYRYEIEVAVLDKEIDELDIKIYEIEAQLSEAEKKYIKQKDLLNKRIVAQYEAGEVFYLDILLSSNDLIEFISNYYLIGEIAELDNDILNSYKAQKERVNSIKQELDKYKNELKQKKDSQEKSAIVLSNIRVLKNSQLSNLSEQEQQLQKEIDEYQKQVQDIEIELLIALTSNLGSEYVGGALAWPVPGYTTITSTFGMRVHPIYGVYRMHTGVDIGGAPIGAFFVAANDGTVVTSRYSSAYGNVVVVDHGGGLSTLYAHGSERLVEVGDEVKRGEPVLKVGSTGISTGPHAHFEVRINGTCVDPLDYILNRNNTNNIE